MKVIVCSVSAVIGTALSFLFGDLTPAFIALIVCTVIDYITGVLKAIKNKTLSSEIGANGIIKKCAIYLMLILAHIVDNAIGSKDVARDTVIFFYLANEGLSIIENIILIGVPVPNKIKKIFLQIGEQSDDN